MNIHQQLSQKGVVRAVPLVA